MTHGRSRYERGCRCLVCKAANTAHCARVRASRLARLLASPVPESDPGHGRINSYNAGCRCEACSTARRVRYLSGPGTAAGHRWREQVVQTYRAARAAWEARREAATNGYLRHRSRSARARSAYRHPRWTDEYVVFLAEHPPPTLRTFLVAMAGAP